MTRDLRSVLDGFADDEGRALALDAPDPRTEALRVRALASRRRAVRLTAAVSGAAAAAVVVGVLAAQGLTSPEPVPPATTPTPTATVSPAPTPTATPTPTAAATPTPTTDVLPTAPAVTWPPAVGEDDAMYSGEGPWWVVVLTRAGMDDREHSDAVRAELEQVGYDVSWTPLRCLVTGDRQESIGLSVPDATVSDPWGEILYFRTLADADAFVLAWDRPVTGVVEANIACGWG